MTRLQSQLNIMHQDLNPMYKDERQLQVVDSVLMHCSLLNTLSSCWAYNPLHTCNIQHMQELALLGEVSKTNGV